MNTIDILQENLVQLEKQNSQLRESLDLQTKFLNEVAKVLEANNKLIKRLVSEKNNFLEHNKLMLEIIKGYSIWDKIIIEFIEASGKTPPKEGPATVYLKTMGLLREEIPKDKD